MPRINRLALKLGQKDLLGRSHISWHKSILGERFGYPPFSIFDARSGEWQQRKAIWASLGIRSELGRGEGLTLTGEVGKDIDNYRHKEKATTYHTGGPGTLSGEMKSRANATVNGSPMPAMDYKNRERGDGRGRPMNKFHAQPGGGPSKKSVWLGANGKPVGGSGAINAKETASLKDGLTWPTSVHPYDGGNSEAGQTGTSIFDPVICELYYRWFTPIGGFVLDPFAGGSVRGIVASILGRSYIGIDLRPEQVAANQEQAEILCSDDYMPKWLVGDSLNVKKIVDQEVDGILSCPPYYDLELYSDNPADLSNMQWDEFCDAYYKIIKRSVSLLKNDRFACFVVGDIRDKQGMYRRLPALTAEFFEDAGCSLYNQAILVTATGSLPLRIHKQFTVSRKLGFSHQEVLVFVKGDPRKATAACETVDTIGQVNAQLRN